MRLLVLGAGGRVGRFLRVCWPEASPVTPLWHGTDALRFDILEGSSALLSAVAKADGVLLLAGVTHDRQDRPLSDNSALARAVLLAAQGKPVWLCSTAAVYGNQPGPLREDTELAPISPYGCAKIAMEDLAADAPNATILRIGNIAGADSLLGTDDRDIVLDQFPDGTYPMRSYIGPHDLAKAICRLTSDAGLNHRVVNVSLPKPVSMAALLQEAGMAWQSRPAPPGAIKMVNLDTKLLWGDDRPSSSAAAIVADWRKARALL